MLVYLTIYGISNPSDAYLVELAHPTSFVDAIVRAGSLVGTALDHVHGDGMEFEEKYMFHTSPTAGEAKIPPGGWGTDFKKVDYPDDDVLYTANGDKVWYVG